MLCNTYMKPLGKVIREFRLWYHPYVDDVHLYLTMPSDPKGAVDLNKCLEVVRGGEDLNWTEQDPIPGPIPEKFFPSRQSLVVTRWIEN